GDSRGHQGADGNSPQHDDPDDGSDHQPDDQLGIHLEKIQSLPVHVGCQHTPDDGQDSGEGGEHGSDLLDGNPPCGKGDQDGDGEKQKSQFQPAPFHGGKKSLQMGQFQDEQQAGGGGNDGRASDQSDDDEDDEEQIRIHGHPLSEVFATTLCLKGTNY